MVTQLLTKARVAQFRNDGTLLQQGFTMKKFALLVAAGAAALSSPAMAAFVVDTGSPTPAGINWSFDPGQSLAAFFTLASATTIQSVEGYINTSAGSTVTIAIHSNGALPVAANTLFSSSLTTTGNGTDAWQGVFNQNWALNAGSYWVSFANTGLGGMRGNAPNPLSNYAFTSSGNWNDFSGLNIGVRLGDSLTAGVPEPASWALMIAGFGLVGGAMRRRRETVRVSFS